MTNVGIGKVKKAQRKSNKEGLPRYYVWVVNNRTQQRKLVNREQALNYTDGRYNEHIGIRVQNLKDQYVLKEIGV